MIYEFQGIKPVRHPSAFVRYTNYIYKIFFVQLIRQRQKN
jgi:hypothetical protein